MSEVFTQLPDRRRGARRPTTTPSKLYWPPEVDIHIVQWRYFPQHPARDRYFAAHIFPALDKLVRNLSRFSKQRDETYQADCYDFVLSALAGALPKWDSTRGTPSFSFFNVCAFNAVRIFWKCRGIDSKREKLVVSVDPRERPRGRPAHAEGGYDSNRSEHRLMREYATKQAETAFATDWARDTMTLIQAVADDTSIDPKHRAVAAVLKSELGLVDTKRPNFKLRPQDAVNHILRRGVMPGACAGTVRAALLEVVALVEKKRAAADGGPARIRPRRPRRPNRRKRGEQ